MTAPNIAGQVAQGFEGVRAEFERNFAERGEIGAAVAVYWKGEKVVDLWGGRRTPEGEAPWQADTLVVVMSSTKGLSAMTLALANARGWLRYDGPVARYWPEFAENGKADIRPAGAALHAAHRDPEDDQPRLAASPIVRRPQRGPERPALPRSRRKRSLC